MKRISDNETIKECILDNLWFKILSFCAVALIFTSMLLPPMGVIDPSIIAASGELCGWGALWTVLVALKKNKNITVQHGQTTVTIDGKKYKLEMEDDEKIDTEE